LLRGCFEKEPYIVHPPFSVVGVSNTYEGTIKNKGGEKTNRFTSVQLESKEDS
jgi:hypothetical protein